MLAKLLKRLAGLFAAEHFVRDPPNVAELRPLYNAVERRFTQHWPSPDALIDKLSSRLDHVPDELIPHFRACIRALMEDHIFFSLPHLRFDLTMRDALELKIRLRQQLAFFDTYEETTTYLLEAVGRLTLGMGTLIPKIVAPSPFTIPLSHALPDYRAIVHEMMNVAAEAKYVELNIYNRLREQLLLNLCDASNIDPDTLAKNHRHLIRPSDSKLPLDEFTSTYLKRTPFRELFNAPVALRLTYQDRFQHTHVVAGSGGGKTTLLENLILYDLKSDDPPGLVVIDSQGDLINKLRKLELFSNTGPFANRFIYVSAKELKHPPAINIFDVQKRLKGYDQAAKEQITAGVLKTFEYLFDGLIGADLTAKQRVLFTMVATLLISLPDAKGRPATIIDMMDLMERPHEYDDVVRLLPPIPRSFFERDFKNAKVFGQTKEQIRYRLQAILSNPTMARLFTAKETKLDFFKEINRGSIILIDTAKDFLKDHSAHYGRTMISLLLQAVMERAAIPEKDRKPVFIVIDEAAEYFDDNIDDFLTEARKQKCGIVLAHQYLDQAKAALRSSLSANTSIKFATSLSMSDARAMAPDMRTTPEFIMNQPRLHFAAHIRNVTPQAVSIPVKVGQLEQEEQLSENAQKFLLGVSRTHVSLSDMKDIIRDWERETGREETLVPAETHDEPQDAAKDAAVVKSAEVMGGENERRSHPADVEIEESIKETKTTTTTTETREAKRIVRPVERKKLSPPSPEKEW